MKLLVALDFSERAERIIAEAEKLAKALRAKVFLLHVVPPPSPIIDVPPDVEAVVPPEKVFKKETEKLLRDLVGTGIPFILSSKSNTSSRELAHEDIYTESQQHIP